MGSKRSRQGGRAAVSGEGSSTRLYVIIGAVIAVLLAGFVALVVIDMRQNAAKRPPSDVKTYDVGPGGKHTDGTVNYAQNPPAGGKHNPVWQNCGFYDSPVRSENAVHSMEHGAVWITYQPDLPKGQVDKLRDLAHGQTYVLVSPYPDLPSPVVASAWGKQVKLQSAEDPALEQFVSAFSQGPQTPEAGAACTGGTGEPS